MTTVKVSATALRSVLAMVLFLAAGHSVRAAETTTLPLAGTGQFRLDPHNNGKLDWAAFLGRNDPVWDALPQKFDHGAFAGNGTLGLTVFQEDQKVLRFAMGRNDVTSRAHDNTRLLMGGLPGAAR